VKGHKLLSAFKQGFGMSAKLINSCQNLSIEPTPMLLTLQTLTSVLEAPSAGREGLYALFLLENPFFVLYSFKLTCSPAEGLRRIYKPPCQPLCKRQLLLIPDTSPQCRNAF